MAKGIQFGKTYLNFAVGGPLIKGPQSSQLQNKTKEGVKKDENNRFR
jgi:hypothetical protein